MAKIVTTIEIDCDPFTGMGRQGDHFRTICEKILHVEYYEPISRFFGCWEWKVEYESEEQQAQVKEFLTDLYNQGLARYCSW